MKWPATRSKDVADFALGAGYAFGKQAKRQTPTGFGALRPAASAGLQRHACVTAIGSFRSCFGAKAGASITSAHGCQLSEDPSDGDGAQRVLGDGLPDLHLFPFESPGGDCDSLILRHLWPPVGFDAAWPIDTVLVPSGHAPRRADSLLGGTNAAFQIEGSKNGGGQLRRSSPISEEGAWPSVRRAARCPLRRLNRSRPRLYCGGRMMVNKSLNPICYLSLLTIYFIISKEGELGTWSIAMSKSPLDPPQ